MLVCRLKSDLDVNHVIMLLYWAMIVLALLYGRSHRQYSHVCFDGRRNVIIKSNYIIRHLVKPVVVTPRLLPRFVAPAVLCLPSVLHSVLTNSSEVSNDD